LTANAPRNPIVDASLKKYLAMPIKLADVEKTASVVVSTLYRFF
jgi:hypothetical protein